MRVAKSNKIKRESSIKTMDDLYKGIRYDEKAQTFLEKIPEILRIKGRPVFFPADSTVIKKEEKTDSVYFVFSGSMKVMNEFDDGNYYSFSILEACTIISDLEVLSGRLVNAATLIALEDVLAIKVNVNDFIYVIRSDITFLLFVSNLMANKMFNSSFSQGKNLYKQGIQKITAYFISYYEKHCEQNKIVRVDRTRQSVASEIGISIKTVNRGIAKLKQIELITVNKGKVSINETQYQNLLEQKNMM